MHCCIDLPLNSSLILSLSNQSERYFLHLTAFSIWSVGNSFQISHLLDLLFECRVLFASLTPLFFFWCLGFHFFGLRVLRSSWGSMIMQMSEWINDFLLHPSWLHRWHHQECLKPILISKIKQPTSQTEQYPQKAFTNFTRKLKGSMKNQALGFLSKEIKKTLWFLK